MSYFWETAETRLVLCYGAAVLVIHCRCLGHLSTLYMYINSRMIKKKLFGVINFSSSSDAVFFFKIHVDRHFVRY